DVRVLPRPGCGLGVYRGWMLTPHQYRLLYEELEAKGLRLLNDPAAYRHCHHLPESYPAIDNICEREASSVVADNIYLCMFITSFCVVRVAGLDMVQALSTATI